MKGFSSFGAPEGRRLEVQFEYNARPSFWGRVGANAHLVVAGIGTAALLGVAAVALWLALPAADRQANASPKPALEEIVPARPVKTTKIMPPSKPVQAAAAATANVAEPPATRTTPKGDAVLPKMAAADIEVATLAANDPRWSGSAAGAGTAKAAPGVIATQPEQASAPSTSAGEAVKEATGSPETTAAEPNPTQTALASSAATAAAVRAEASPKGKADGYQTAAIPAIRPDAPEPVAAGDAEVKTPPAEAATPEATHTERVQSGVTMRAGARNGASAITTIPAKTPVQVVSCSAWCEIIYKGRRGFIYKSFLGRGGSTRPAPTKVSDPAQPKQPAAAAPAPAKPEAGEPKKTALPGAGTFGHK